MKNVIKNFRLFNKSSQLTLLTFNYFCKAGLLTLSFILFIIITDWILLSFLKNLEEVNFSSLGIFLTFLVIPKKIKICPQIVHINIRLRHGHVAAHTIVTGEELINIKRFIYLTCSHYRNNPIRTIGDFINLHGSTMVSGGKYNQHIMFSFYGHYKFSPTEVREMYPNVQIENQQGFYSLSIFLIFKAV